MLEARIKALRRKINRLADADIGFDNVYNLSVKLDKLIVKYYSEKNGRRDR